jgi:RHH-type proline utilization regulon transcriptional repressor/proline dehydrogenase/delta 1-pyrroline-5-carboxylate dehydrogenase
VGAHRDLLAYLVRRLLENGANSSFVHQLTDESVGMAELLISPLRLEPHSAFALPPQLFGTTASARKNSSGIDLTVETMRAPLLAAYAATTVPVVAEYAVAAIPEAVKTSLASYKAWSKTAVSDRAGILRAAADALDAQLPTFCALLVKEAFKTWGDAVSEVREAVDFLRYYADEAERVMTPIALPGPTGETNELRLIARGPWVCISPWNFRTGDFCGSSRRSTGDRQHRASQTGRADARRGAGHGGLAA